MRRVAEGEQGRKFRILFSVPSSPLSSPFARQNERDPLQIPALTKKPYGTRSTPPKF